MNSNRGGPRATQPRRASPPAPPKRNPHTMPAIRKGVNLLSEVKAIAAPAARSRADNRAPPPNRLFLRFRNAASRCSSATDDARAHPQTANALERRATHERDTNDRPSRRARNASVAHRHVHAAAMVESHLQFLIHIHTDSYPHISFLLL
ncbi:hypothetical protein WS86_27950 [Burkholderia savannae]|uniref:Uncharacterized protein n=2 Tax=Burkholderia TaxID=32008 RepID=A0ABR5T4C8_9BURK|nr:hypothetical protein WS86_27950 [Burkholderia savannae]KWZ37680.1 hypothetical protein WS72_22255 [Burkholderia savannae]